MATTYTPNYHLGKQEDRSDKFVMKIITDNMDIIDEQLKATDDKATAAAAGLKYKGAVNYYSDLPNDAELGDAYTVLYAGSSGTVPDGTEYVWGELNGTAQWIDFSKDTYTKAEVNALLAAKQSLLNANNKLDPAYINYDSTHRAVSDTEKSTWNGKQNAIDSSHKLSADLVDDTRTTNKFATAAELEQIQTNKNNILTDNKWSAQTAVGNLCPTQNKTVSGQFADITFLSSVPIGQYEIYCSNVTSNDTDSNTCQIAGLTANSAVATNFAQIGRGDDVHITLTVNSPMKTMRLYSADSAAHGAGDTATFTDIMLIRKSSWDSGVTTYQPYTMTNADITAWIIAHS